MTATEATDLDLDFIVDGDEAQAEDSYILVRLGGSRYAVDMGSVAEVGRLPRLTRVPGTPSWTAGVANWRGRILAVIDVRPLLGASATPTGSLGRLVVLGEDAVTVGLLTESVLGTVTGLGEQIETVPPTLDVAAMGLLRGQVADPDGPVVVLDVRAVMGLRRQLTAVHRIAS